MRRFLALAFLSLAMASPSHADLVSTASVNPFGPCGLPQSNSGTSSASATACAYPQGGSASTSINFAITPSTLATWAFSDGAGQSTNAMTSSLFNNQLVVTGGSGSGFLALTFVESNVMGNNDPQASASFQVVASLNGVQYSDVRICGNPPATEGIVCTNPTDPIGVAFTFGVPFDLSVALDAVAGGGLAGIVPFTSIQGDGTLDYSLPSGDVLTTYPAPSNVPEPACALLIVTGISTLILRRRAAPLHQ